MRQLLGKLRCVVTFDAQPCNSRGVCYRRSLCQGILDVYSDRDMVGMPMAWYFRRAFEKVFMALRCSLLVRMCYSLGQSEFMCRYDFNNTW